MGTLVPNKQIISGLHLHDKLDPWGLSALNFTPCTQHDIDAPCTNHNSASHLPNSNSQSLDHQIWGQLHPELVERVLSYLPLTSRIHTRRICKTWDREIFSGRILGSDRDSSSKKQKSSWFFLFENGGSGQAPTLHAYDPMRDEWNSSTTVPNFAVVQKIGGLALCGAASGLMLYKISALKSYFTRFGVFNPMTRSWKKLPPLLNRRQRPVVTMFRDPGSYGGYNVVVAGGVEYDQQVHSTEVYDSRTECWKISCEKFINYQNHVSSEMRTTTVYCAGVVYHMRFNQLMAYDPNREFHSFLAYDTRRARWRPLRVPPPPDLVFTEYPSSRPSLKRIWKNRPYATDILPPLLIECKGRLLLIGFLEDQTFSSVSGLGIWELHVTRRMWNPLTTMPENVFGKFCPKVCTSAYVDPPSYLRYKVQAAGHEDLLYIFQANGAAGTPVILCDLSQSPPAWRCIHEGGVVQHAPHAEVQGCVIDLRLDTLI